MRKIEKVILFLNRNIVCIDDQGEIIQKDDMSGGIDDTTVDMPNWEHVFLKRVIDDRVTDIRIARWQGASMSVTIGELCFILGHGEWYQREFLLLNKRGDRK